MLWGKLKSNNPVDAPVQGEKTIQKVLAASKGWHQDNEDQPAAREHSNDTYMATTGWLFSISFSQMLTFPPFLLWHLLGLHFSGAPAFLYFCEVMWFDAAVFVCGTTINCCGIATADCTSGGMHPEGLHSGMEVLYVVARCTTCCHCNLLFVGKHSLFFVSQPHGSALLARKKKNTTTINHLCNRLGHGNACIRDLRARDMDALWW